MSAEGIGSPTPEEEAIDADVLASLQWEPTPAIDITSALGWVWPADAPKLQASLRRLHQQGVAEVVYGQGWRLV